MLLLLASAALPAWSFAPSTPGGVASSLALGGRCVAPRQTLSSSPWLVPPFRSPAAATEEAGGDDDDFDDFIVRSAQSGDAFALARLCTDSFFGTHTLADGPFVFFQRFFIWTKVLRQVSRRIAIEGEGRECRLLVAVDGDGDGDVKACCDVAIHLFDKELNRFELMVDEFPRGKAARRRFGWRPYVASMAVAASERRRGIGRQLLLEAESTAKRWGYRDLMLEVAVENDAARGFYSKQGYRLVREGNDSSGVGATVVRVMGPDLLRHWTIEDVDKCLMKKGL